MSYKNLLSLNDLTDTEINQLLDVASEMRRVVLSRVKRGPQLLGKVLAIAGNYDDLSRNCLSLACGYLSGLTADFFKTPCYDDILNIKAAGVDYIVIEPEQTEIARLARDEEGVVTYGGKYSGALAALAILFTIKQRLETIKSVDVSLLGNLQKGYKCAEDLNDILLRFESRASVCGYDKNIANYFKEKSIRVYSDINMVTHGADFIIDFGGREEENIYFYGDSMGLTQETIKLAQPNAPLLFKNRIFSKEKGCFVTYPFSATADYYTNLTAVTMAVLYLLKRN